MWGVFQNTILSVFEQESFENLISVYSYIPRFLKTVGAYVDGCFENCYLQNLFKLMKKSQFSEN